MTVRSKTVKRNGEIKRMLLEGIPLSFIARLKEISPTRAGQIRDMFLASGELMEVPSSKPRAYIDPRAHALGTELAENDGGAENNGLPRDSTGVRDSLPPNGKLPFGMVNAHVSGRIRMTVLKKGNFDDVKGKDGLYIGYWDEARSGGKGKTHWKCHLRLFRQELTVNYYESAKGTTEFYVNPGRVYYYPSKVTQAQAMDHIIRRVLYVAELLKENGWQVKDPQLPRNYQMHVAKEGDPLAVLIPPRYHGEGQDIISDTSPDYLETELEHATDDQLVKIYASMPSAIHANAKAIEENAAKIESSSKSIESMRIEILGLKEVVDLQRQTIEGLVGNVTALTKAVTCGVTAQTAMATAVFPRFTGEGYQ